MKTEVKILKLDTVEVMTDIKTKVFDYVDEQMSDFTNKQLENASEEEALFHLMASTFYASVNETLDYVSNLTQKEADVILAESEEDFQA